MPDGSVLQTPGFNGQFGVDYPPFPEHPQVPLNPTQQEAIAAMARLQDIICYFPFLSASHCSVPLALMLKLVARSSCFGNTPLFTSDGSPSGSESRWTDAVRQPLVWLNELDPFETRGDMVETAGGASIDTK